MAQLQNVRILVCTSQPDIGDAVCRRFGENVQASSICLLPGVEGQEERLLVELCEEIRKTQAHIVIVESSLLSNTQQNRQTLMEIIQPRQFIWLHDQPTASLEMILETQFSEHWIIREQTLQPLLIEELLNRIVWQERAQALAIEQGNILKRFARDYYESLTHEEATQHDIEREFEEILERLFPSYSRMSVEPMPLQYAEGNQRTSLVQRSRSQVFLAIFRDDRLPAVVKIARKEKIRREIHNFKTNVQYKIGGLRHAIVEKDVTLWNIGGIAYSFIGAAKNSIYVDDSARTIPTLSAHILNTADTASLMSLIKGLYQSWKLHYSRKETLYGSLRLYGQYNNAWDSKLDAIMESPPPVDVAMFLPDSLNPFEWLQQQKDSSPFAIQQCIIHGDMHADNVFVDGQFCWFIDFERSTKGPILQDFVELEVDLLTRLVDLDPENSDERDLLYDLYVAVCEHKRPIAPVLFSTATSKNTQTRKYTNVVRSIREQAAHLTQYSDSRDYLWGLLFNSIFRAAYALGDQAREKLRYRSLLLASVLCSRLEKWEVASLPPQWPPQDWPAVDLGSRIESDEVADRPSHFEHGYALLIGIGPTPNAPHLSLAVPEKDTIALAQLLIDQERCGYLPGNVRVLTNDLADLDQIRREFKWLERIVKSDKDATAIVYFSGHGVRWRENSTNDRYGLIPSDIRIDQDGYPIEGTVLWSTEFADLLESIDAKRLLVLIDACHAEGMTSKDDNNLLFPHGLQKSPPPLNLLENLQAGQGRAVISSCTGEQQSYILPDGSLSLFTHHLLEALRGVGSSADTEIRVSDILQYVGRAVPLTAQNRFQREQTPFTDMKGTDFPIALLPKTRE